MAQCAVRGANCANNQPEPGCIRQGWDGDRAFAYPARAWRGKQATAREPTHLLLLLRAAGSLRLLLQLAQRALQLHRALQVLG